MKYMLLALIFASNAFACPNHLRVGAGTPAPCNGHFFNDKSELKIRTELTIQEKRIENLEQSLKLKDLAIEAKMSESELWASEARKQAKLAASRENDFRNGVYMGIGGTILLYLLIGAAKR